MEILTPTGYKLIDDVNIGDEIIGKDGVINTLLNKRVFDKTWFEEQNCVDQWKWFNVNGKKFFNNQNIYVSLGDYNLCHTSELRLGWKIVRSDGSEEEITSLVETTEELVWYKLDVSGDHSFITQDTAVHNASRYWVGGGSTANWNDTVNTNWSATSAGSNNASVPTTTDDVFFDGAGTNGNTASTISATITILSFTSSSGYTSTITRNAVLTVAGNVTIHKNTVWAGSSGMIISTTSTITATGFTAGDTFWNQAMTFTGTTTKTLVSASNDIKITGVFTVSVNTVINRTTSETLTLNGGLTLLGNVSGTAKIILTGGTWSGSFQVSNSLDIQGAVTVSGTVVYSTGTLKYVSGAVTVTGSTLQLNLSSTLDCVGMTWSGITLNTTAAANTITLTTNLACSGNLVSNVTTGSVTINGSSFYIGGNFTSNSTTTGSILGTTNLIINGSTPTVSMSALTSGVLRNNIEFAHTGICTITGGAISGANGGFRYGPASGSSTMTFTSGTISVTNRLMLIVAASSTVNVTCNTSGITLLYLAARTTNATASHVFNGTNGLTFGTLDLQYTGSNSTTLTFKFGNTYTVSTYLRNDISGIVASNQTTKFSIVSDTPGSKVAFTLAAAASQNLYHVDFTDIDASGGQTIYTYDGPDNVLALSNVTNIRETPTGPVSAAY